MKRIITIILTIFAFVCFFTETMPKTYADISLRNYKPIKLAKGSFLKAVSQREISTATAQVGDVEYFINPADIYVGTSNIIPKNSVFLGEIQGVIAAVEGINAAMKIKIYKVLTPDGAEYAMNANVYRNGSITLGGDLSEIAYYTKIPHYAGTWKYGALQFVPTTIREMGKPTVIRVGEEVTIIINEDQSIYKPIE